MKYYVCNHCGNIIEFAKNNGVPVMCCGEKMSELVPGTSDGAAEKHVPVVKIDKNHVTVEIGSVEHPMVEEHYIEWIAIETKKAVRRLSLHHRINQRQSLFLQMVMNLLQHMNIAIFTDYGWLNSHIYIYGKNGYGNSTRFVFISN